VPDARVIDPAGFTGRPKEPLAAASFALALPSPAFLASRLEATRPPLRTGVTRILPMISGVSYEDTGTLAQAPPPPPPIQDPPMAAPPPPPPPPVVVAMPLPEPPIEIYYPVPVYTGVVVINPPERTVKPADRAPGPPPTSDTSTRTISDRRKPKSVDQNAPSGSRGDDPPRDHHVTTAGPGHTEPPVHISPPPREDPRPPAPRTPVAPVAQPSHEAKPVESAAPSTPPPARPEPASPRIPAAPVIQPSHDAKPIAAPPADKDRK
jgi:hypothetical protein